MDLLCSSICSYSENTAKTSESLPQALIPGSADEESDGAALAGTACAAAVSSPVSSHPCAHHTSSEAVHIPVTSPTHPKSDHLVHGILTGQKGTLLSEKSSKEGLIHLI